MGTNLERKLSIQIWKIDLVLHPAYEGGVD